MASAAGFTDPRCALACIHAAWKLPWGVVEATAELAELDWVLSVASGMLEATPVTINNGEIQSLVGAP